MKGAIMKKKISPKLWTLIILALLILMALTAQPCMAGLIWSG
jgi:hypothetical protein